MTTAESPHIDLAPLREVAGKVAFVTGGSSGIGLGLARAFTAAGMKVIFTYRNPAHRDEALHALADYRDKVYAMEVDVADRTAMQNAATDAVQVFGPIHLLCNNAGIGLPAGISNSSYEDWDWAFNVNVHGVFNGIRAFLPHFREHGQGAHIVSTASAAGLVAARPLGVYTATKFAVVGMMEALRIELEPEQIGVSVFCPGLVQSDIHNAERNRPGADAVRSVAPTEPEMPASLKSFAMDPLEAGTQVLDGIRRNQLYILTHPEFAGSVRERSEALLASFSKERPPAARVEMVNEVLLSNVYARQRDFMQGQRVHGDHT